MTNALKIEWLKKNRKLWRKELQKMKDIKFYCLNITEQYNYNTNNVVIADQLRGSYQINKWMCKIK